MQGELEGQKNAKAEKEAGNEAANSQMMQLVSAVGAQQKVVGSTNFDGLVLTIAELKGRMAALATGAGGATDETQLLAAKLGLAEAEATKESAEFGLSAIDGVSPVFHIIGRARLKYVCKYQSCML